MAELILYGLAWGAFLAWWLSLLGRFRPDRFPRLASWRSISGTGNLLLWCHIIIAFGWQHQWSIVKAAEHTEQIVAKAGWGHFPGTAALLINLLFVTGWSLALWGIRSPRQALNSRDAAVEIGLWLVAGFFWLQATIVFATSAFVFVAAVLFCVTPSALSNWRRPSR